MSQAFIDTFLPVYVYGFGAVLAVSVFFGMARK